MKDIDIIYNTTVDYLKTHYDFIYEKTMLDEKGELKLEYLKTTEDGYNEYEAEYNGIKGFLTYDTTDYWLELGCHFIHWSNEKIFICSLSKNVLKSLINDWEFCIPNI